MDAETPEVIRHLERVRYHGAAWHEDAGIKQRGLGIRDISDPNVSETKLDSIPLSGHQYWDSQPMGDVFQIHGEPGPRMRAIAAERKTFMLAKDDEK